MTTEDRRLGIGERELGSRPAAWRVGRRQSALVKARSLLFAWSWWAFLRRAWIRILRTSDAESATLRIFSENFERSFRRVFWYVSRRVNDQEILERIVSDVLEENLDILVIQGDAPGEADRLRVSANRLIAQVKGSEQPDTDAQNPKTELR
jgi:hypothetical protein